MNSYASKDWWEQEGADFRFRDFHYEVSRPYRLWFEYLRLSDTYASAVKLVAKKASGKLREEDLRKLPQDINKVIEVADHFGDVRAISFKSWWLHYGIDLFGKELERPGVHKLAVLKRKEEGKEDQCISSLKHYMKVNRKEARFPETMLLAIPLVGNKEEILKDISHLISQQNLHPIDKPQRILFHLAGKRTHLEPLKVGIRLLHMKAASPDETLWRLGVGAGVSKKHSNLDVSIKAKLPDEMVEKTQALATLTARSIRTARLTMENAIRGRFPCHDEVELSDINFEKLNRTIQKTLAFERRYVDEYELLLRGVSSIDKGSFKLDGLARRRAQTRKGKG